MLLLQLDQLSRVPISEQLVNGVVRMTACGVLTPGEQLPSVRTLAQEMGINPNTVQKAYRTLEQMGTIYSLPGKGSFVSGGSEAQEARKRQMLTRLNEALKNAMDAGFSAGELAEHCRGWLRETGGAEVV